MQELHAFLAAHGFVVPNAQCHGKIIRFDIEGKKSTGWFIGWEHHSTASGKTYTFALIGNWATDERFEFQTDMEYSEEDIRIIKKHRSEAQKKHAEETAKINEEVAIACERLFAQAKETGSSPYIEKKRLGGLFGARIKEGSSGFEVLVPCRDDCGKLWGYQRILANSDKRFVAGQKKAGTFHQIGPAVNERDTVLVCEGFATGVSTYQATSKTSIVAFDAGNLECVARLMRKNYPHCRLVIAADNDQWGEKNVGVEKALAAARASGAKVIIPKFKDPTQRGTDWNDLLIQEGIEEVRRQLADLPPERFVQALGHDEKEYFYTSSETAQVKSFTACAHTALNLYSLMAEDYWLGRFGGKNGVEWSKAASALMAECRKRGVFSNAKIRGSGGWSEDGELLLNLGDRLLTHHGEVGLRDIESPHIYTIGERNPGPDPSGLDLCESKRLFEVVRSFNWRKDKYARFAAGFLVVAPFCGALQWRPHLWVTGASGSGKSSFFDYVARVLISGFGESVAGQTTEAGIRQTLKYNAKCIIFDEFETNDRRSSERIKGVLDFMRLASSDSESSVLKGGAHGSSQSYKPRSSCIVGSVRVNLTQDTDRNRFTVVELIGNENSPSQWEALQKQLDFVTPEIAARLHGRTVQGWAKIMESAKNFQKVLGVKFNQRFGQQHGILLSGYYSLISDSAITIDEAQKIVEEMDWVEEAESITETDAQDCFDLLLHHKVLFRGLDSQEDLTIAELIDRDLGPELCRFGIRVVPGASGINLVVANSHPELKKIFKDTRWESGWARSLGRIPGASPGERMRFTAKNAIAATEIPYELAK